jgi:nucleoid-associated protein EbfC
MDLNNLLKQAQNIKSEFDKKQKEFSEKEFVGSAGGALVRAKVKGNKQIVKIDIAEKLLQADNKSTVEDLVVAAINSAFTDVDTKAKELAPNPMDNIPGNIGDIDLNKILDK